MVGKTFKVGDLVWARLPGQHLWPGKIEKAPKNLHAKNKKGHSFVKFFSTNNSVWVKNNLIIPHSEEMLETSPKRKSASLKKAIDEINQLALNGTSSEEAPPENTEENMEHEITESTVSSYINEAQEKEVLSVGEMVRDEQSVINVECFSDYREVPENMEHEITEVKVSSNINEALQKEVPSVVEMVCDEESVINVECFSDYREAPESTEGNEEHKITDSTISSNVNEALEKVLSVVEMVCDEQSVINVDCFSDDIEETCDNEDGSFLVPYEELGDKSTAVKVFAKHSNLEHRLPNGDEKEQLIDISLSKMTDNCVSEELLDSVQSIDSTDVLQNPCLPKVSNFVQPIALQNQKDSQIVQKVGFLGLGMMGSAIVRHLTMSGCNVTVWNRTLEKCKSFISDGACQGESPSDVVAKCDIIFSCVSDPEASKYLVFGPQGVLKGLEGSEAGSKGYVELSSNDPITSEEIGKAISSAGGMYLEAPVSLSKEPEKDKLLLIAAGNRDLFDLCVPYFSAISKTAYFLSSDVGAASIYNISIGMFHGSLYASLAEALRVIGNNNLSPNTYLNFLDQRADLTTFLLDKGRAMIEHNFSVNTTLKHQQKLSSMALALDVDHELPVGSAAHVVFSRACEKK